MRQFTPNLLIRRICEVLTLDWFGSGLVVVSIPAIFREVFFA